MMKKYTGSCVCGAVQIEVRGEPRYTGYCHCGDCRAWLGAPVNAFSIWNNDQVTIKAGTENLVGFSKTSHAIRKRCASCGCAVLSEHPEKGFIDVFASFLDDFDHNPRSHVHYEERMIDMRDGLPKYRKLPSKEHPAGDMPEI